MVLQRWQSVYLFVAAVLMLIYAFSPIAELSVDSATYVLSMCCIERIEDTTQSAINDGGYNISYIWGFFVIAILIVILSVVTIFKFKNLKFQKKLCVISGSLTAILLASLMIFVYLIDCDMYSVSYTNLLPIFALIMFYLADRGISKDQKILSSYDRIR